MDAMMASTLISSWELLAQLAQFGQRGATEQGAQHCAEALAGLLARYLPSQSGRLEVIEADRLEASASWGDETPLGEAPLPIYADQVLIGRLQLGGLGGATLDPNFALALAAQLGLILLTYRRSEEVTSISRLRNLVSKNLEQVGLLDLRTLLTTALDQSLPLIAMRAAALYSADESTGQLHLLASSSNGFAFPLSLPIDGPSLAAYAASSRSLQLGKLAPAPNRRRSTSNSNPPGERIGMTVPLLARDELVGVLALTMPAGQHMPSTLQQRLAAAFAEQVTLLVRNARLFSQQQQRARELFVLYENSQEINTTTQISSMLIRATENIALALEADYCAVLLTDLPDTDTLRTEAIYSELSRSGNLDSTEVVVTPASMLLSQLARSDAQVITNLSATTNPLADELQRQGCRSALMIPLRGKDQTVGLLVVGFTQAQRGIGGAERNLAQVLGTQVATAIINRRLYVAEQQRAAELELLQRISQQLTAELSLDETLAAILESVQALAHFSGARITLYDGRSRELRPATSCGLQQVAPADPDTLSSWLARHKRPLRSADLTQQSDQPGLTLDDGAPARAYLGVPLRLGEELIGTLELMSSRAGAFSGDDERLLTIIAGQSAQAIANANRYEQADTSLRSRIEQLRALQRVSSQLAITLDQNEILEYVLEQALKATGASHGLIALHGPTEDSGDEQMALSALGGQQAPEIYRKSLIDDPQPASVGYMVVEAVGYHEPYRSQLMGSMLSAQAGTAQIALQRRQPELSDTLAESERAAISCPEAQSALAAPIFYQAGIAGVLLLLSPQPHSFDYDAVEFLRALTHQAAVGIGNAQRYAELEHLSKMLQRRAAILNDVLEIGQALRADRSLASLLEQVGYSAIESANFRTILFCLADPDSPQVLRPQVAAGIPLSELDRMSQSPLPEALATRYLDSRFRIGRSYFVPEPEALEIEAGFETAVFDYTSFDDERAPDEWQYHDRLCVPLYSTEGNMLGLMFVSDPFDRKRPTVRSVEPLEIFADQAAIAIENHYLLRDARARAEQMAALFQVGTAATSTTDLDTLLERVYQEIVAYLGTPSFFYIASYQPERQQICFELMMRQGEILAASNKTLAPKSGITARIIDSGRPLLIHDMQAMPELSNEVVRHDSAGQVRSWLGVPLISQGRVIGVVSVQDFAPNVFTERDLQFLSALANQLAIALENARLFNERERRIAELHVINRIGQITSSTLNTPEMLRQVYAQLSGFLSLDSLFIFIYDEDESVITLSLQADEGEVTLDSSLRAPSTGSLTEQIIRTRLPLQFSNLRVEAPQRGFRPIPFGSDRQSASWLGVPLLVGDGSVVGVIAVMSYTENLYDERERSFLTTVANQLALGVQNTSLLERARRQVEQLGLLNRVSLSASASAEIGAIYQVIVDAMAEATGVDQARLVIYDRKAGQAPAVAEHVPSGLLASIAIPLIDNPAIAWLDEHKQPLVAIDAQHEPLLVPSHATFRELDIRSIALIPLTVDNRVIGAVGLDFVGRSGDFNPQALELCRTIANQTATAIARAQSFNTAQANAEALRQKVGELSTLLDAARILSSLLRPQEVLDKLMELVSRQLSVTTVALWTIGEDGILVPAALDGIPVEQGRLMRVPVGQGMTGYVAETGTPLVIHDVNQSGGSLYPSYQRDNNLISFMGVPVVYRERTIGVLSVMTNYRREFSDDEMLLLVGLADQAAAALENARLFEERERRINELSTINRISAAVNASLDPQDLLEKLHRGVGEIIDVSTSIIAIYDAATDTLTYPVIYDQGRRMRVSPQPLRSGTNAWVIRSREALLLHTLADAQAMGLIVDDTRIGDSQRIEESYLVAPIIYGTNVLGVINIQSYEPHAFDENDLRFLTTVANQAAVALNNARLFSETRQNAAEMTTLFEVTQNLSSTLDPDETQLLVAESALRLLGVEICAVLRLDRKGQIERQVLADRNGFHDDVLLDIRLNGLTAELLQQEQPLAIGDYHAFDNANPQAVDLGIRSVLGMVVGSQAEKLGVIWIGSLQPHEWSPHQISLLSILANQAGQALKSAQLFQMEQSRRRLADTLRDVAQSFTSTLALREIQTLILNQLSRVVTYDSAAVLLRDEHYGHLQITEARGIDQLALLDADFDVDEHPLFMSMAQERRPLLIEDTQHDSRFAPFANLGWTARSWIGAPLLVDNELVGVLTVGGAQAGAYDAEAVEVTFALASQASQAIQNARLFDQISNLAADLERRVSERTAELEQATRQLSQEKDRLEAVHTITLELTTQLDLNSIILSALELISQNVGVSRGSIMLRDTEEGALVCRAVLYHEGGVRAANIPLSFEEGEGLAGWVMLHQEPVNIPDVLRDERWLQAQGRADDVRSVAGVPLKTSDAALGVLILSSPEVAYFTDSQMNLLGTIASVVAAAVSNAQLYNFITELATKNAVLLEDQREETAKSAAVFRSVTEGVIVLDPQQQITLFNPAAEQVLEIPASEVLGRPIEAINEYGGGEIEHKRAQTIYGGLLNGLRQVRQIQGIYSTSIDLTDPAQVIAVNMAPVFGPDGQRYGNVAVLRDITREIEADQAKRQFISDVSHELRTPLTAIKGYVDVLLLSGIQSLNNDQISYLNIIKNNTNRLKSLIEDILEFSRPDSKRKLNFSPVEIPMVIHEVVQSLRLEYERKQMQVTVDTPDTLPTVIADQKRITQVVFNLFSNAVKYTFEGGRIQVRAFLNRANMMQIDVEDSGVGMSPEQRKKLFRPFYRADNPLRDVAGGTGLGLSIAKSFVEQHGGEMWVTSELRKGSTFSFIIPLQQTEANPDEDAE